MPSTIKTPSMCHHLTEGSLAIQPSLQHQIKISPNQSQFEVIGVTTNTNKTAAKNAFTAINLNIFSLLLKP